MNQRIDPPHGVLRTLSVVLACAFMSSVVFAQESEAPRLHTPAEILKIMEASSQTYEIGMEYAAAPADSPVVLSNQMYLKPTGSGYALVYLSLSDEAQPILDKAEQAFHGKKFTEAIAQYRKLLEVEPGYIHALTLIGDTYFRMNQWDSAKANFLRAIELNFADYDAHWFLADTYARMGEADSAIREITIAHVLNVNHADLREAIRLRRKSAGRSWNAWTFTPEYTISKQGDKVVINTTPDWMGYAMVKAVWAHEPGYAASMLDRPRDSLAVVWPEEKEAIMTLLVTKEKFPRISEIVEKGFFQEFVLYEITARRIPKVLVLLPHDDLMRVVDYVNTFH